MPLLTIQKKHPGVRLQSALPLILLLAALASRPGFAAEQFPKPVGLVNDFAGVIAPEYEERLVGLTREVLAKTQVPVVVVAMAEIGEADYNEYANRLYAAWGIGKKGEDRGVLIFLAVKERKMRIETGYGVEGILPDGLVGEIRDRYMLPYLGQDRFGEGLLAGAVAIAQVIAKDAGVELTGQPLLKPPARGKGRSGLSTFLVLLVFLGLLVSLGRGRSGLLPWLLLMSMGRGGAYRGHRGGSFGSGFGGFSGGFGGFGGGSSGGGGAGGSF